jgi:mono/diheme cytochrome c family protein
MTSVVALVASGCGAANQPPPDGHAVFRSACSGCHTLAGEGSRSPVGGDLGGYRMTVAEVVNFTKIMPTARPLSAKEIGAVSAFVWSVQRRSRRP